MQLPRKPRHLNFRHESSTFRRIISVPLGIGYIWMVAFLLSQIVPASFSVTLAIVLAGVSVQVAILINFSLRLLRSEGNANKFSISSIFYLTIYLGVFLAVIRVAVASSPARRAGFNFAELTGILIVGVAFMTISTIVLISLAESLMWIAATLLNFIIGRRSRL